MITKSGTNAINGSAFVMLRPGDWDARPPLARGQGALQPAAVRRRRSAGRWSATGPSSSAATSTAASAARWRSPRRRRPCPSVKTPADEHQGHVRGSTYRFTDKNSLAVRYNMVRWHKDNETGGLNLPGTGFIWDNNVDTVHGDVHERRLGAVPERSARRSTRATPTRRAAKCDAVEHRPHHLLDQRLQRPGHLGRAARGDLGPVRHACRSGGQAHHQDRRRRSPTT